MGEQLAFKGQRKSCSVDVKGGRKGERLGALLSRLIDAAVTDDKPRSEIVGAMGRAAGISASTVNQIVNAGIECPPLDRLAGLARGLGVSRSRLVTEAEADGCDYGESGRCAECEKSTKELAIREFARFVRTRNRLRFQ